MPSNSSPMVSVVIPTHNRPELVVGAVRSVLNQSYRNLELIVVDVGLETRAKNALREFESDTRFHYLESPDELLGGAARNVGAKNARGVYLAFLDDDDEWITEKLEIQITALMEASDAVGFCFSAVTNDFGNGKEVITVVDDGEKDFSELAYRRMKGFLTVTLVIKKSVFDAVGGFDETLPSHQDPELILRIAQQWKGLGINKPLVRVNMRGDHDSVGKSFDRRIRGREMVLKKHFAEFSKRPQALARHYFWIGLWSRDSGNPKVAGNYFKKAFLTSMNPRYLYHWVWTFVTFLGKR